MSSGFKRVDRNIYLHRGLYRVVVKRQQRQIWGGNFRTLDYAILKRNEIESVVHKSKAGNRSKLNPTTPKSLRLKRAAMNLCTECGDEPPKPGCKSCATCLLTAKIKRNTK